jgi:hypothetical protein
MPEMLWAVLLTGALERRDYLQLLRNVAILCRTWFYREEGKHDKPPSPADAASGLNIDGIIDQSTLSEVSDAQFDNFLQIILVHPLGYAALRPLLLLDSIPGIERWRKALSVEPMQADWAQLAEAIGRVLDHQSEASTDIRWHKFISVVISGRMYFPQSMADTLESVRLFPDRGDMRHIRPFIRSGEMNLRRHPPSKWIQAFWAEVSVNTLCIDPSPEDRAELVETTIDPHSLYAARDQVIDRFRRHLGPERVHPKLDCAFGLVLYALSIVEEIGLHRIQTRIVGRLALRSLVEANITLRYLLKMDDGALWKSYRVYGAGQAKLAFLKAQEMDDELPPFLEEDTLHALANEDVWQEYLEIDVGHWARSNLRALAIECDAKDTYDRYYDWTSTFAHSHWGAVRDTNFSTCYNPLHRLHRIPRRSHRVLTSVDADALSLMNEMILALDSAFPAGQPLPAVGART